MTMASDELKNAARLFRDNQLAPARRICRAILDRDPRQADACNLLGVICRQEGKPEEALALFDSALAARGSFFGFHLNRGLALTDMGRFSEAVTSLLRAIELNGSVADAYAALGVAHRGQGQPTASLAALDAACGLQPRNAPLHNMRGVALRELQRFDDAEAAYRHSIDLASNIPEPYSNLSELLCSRGRYAEAEASARKALALRPEDLSALNNLGNALKAQGFCSQAVAIYDQLLSLKGDFAQAAYNRGNALQLLGRPEDAIASYRNALGVDPGFAICQSALACATNYLTDYDPEAAFGEHLAWVRNHVEGRFQPVDRFANDPSAGRRLRIGYVSPDLRRHPVGYFLEPVLANHDRSRFEVVCYATNPASDEVTERLKKHSTLWRDVQPHDPSGIADAVRGDGIDILVDLSGHTAGHCLMSFARRPAPVQVTWMGYVNTTGLPTMDYIITDWHQTPAGTPQRYTETVVRMPRGYVCYRPQAEAPDVGSLPALARGHVTFGCFNNLAKVNTRVLSTWARVLQAVPGSQLLMMTSSLNDPSTRRAIADTFERHGIAGSRVRLQPGAPAGEALSWYDQVDIALDPFPYVGGLTTMEAMWMGVPTVTLAGQGIAGRHSVSHLSNAGLGDFIAADIPEYVALAGHHAGDLDRLARLRAGLRTRVQDSPLLDHAGFTRSLEQAFDEMWRRWRSGTRLQAGGKPLDASPVPL